MIVIYVLDFDSHTFKSCSSYDEALKVLNQLQAHNVTDEKIEVVVCPDGIEVRYTPDEFRHLPD